MKVEVFCTFQIPASSLHYLPSSRVESASVCCCPMVHFLHPFQAEILKIQEERELENQLHLQTNPKMTSQLTLQDKSLPIWLLQRYMQVFSFPMQILKSNPIIGNYRTKEELGIGHAGIRVFASAFDLEEIFPRHAHCISRHLSAREGRESKDGSGSQFLH